MKITTRIATDHDYWFAFELKKMAEYEPIKAVFGWDDVVQERLHQQEWLEGKPTLILSDNEPIGSFMVEDWDDYLYFCRFFLLPEYHGRGIGSAVLSYVVKRADHENKVCKLNYLQGNRVGRLYERYDFKKVSEDEQLIYMERVPMYK